MIYIFYIYVYIYIRFRYLYVFDYDVYKSKPSFPFCISLDFWKSHKPVVKKTPAIKNIQNTSVAMCLTCGSCYNTVFFFPTKCSWTVETWLATICIVP